MKQLPIHRRPKPPSLRSEVRAAHSLRSLAPEASRGDLAELVAAIHELGEQTRRGELGELEALLSAQACTLAAAFDRLVAHAGEYLQCGRLESAERVLRLGLRAQGRCVETVRALADLKRPPAVRIAQANIAHGPQQVNNGPSQQSQGGNGHEDQADAPRLDG